MVTIQQLEAKLNKRELTILLKYVAVVVVVVVVNISIITDDRV